MNTVECKTNKGNFVNIKENTKSHSHDYKRKYVYTHEWTTTLVLNEFVSRPIKTNRNRSSLLTISINQLFSFLLLNLSKHTHYQVCFSLLSFPLCTFSELQPSGLLMMMLFSLYFYFNGCCCCMCCFFCSCICIVWTWFALTLFLFYLIFGDGVCSGCDSGFFWLYFYFILFFSL